MARNLARSPSTRGSRSGSAIPARPFSSVPCRRSLMLILVFGLIDLSRAIFDAQVIANLSGQGSSMASRGTTLANTAAAVAASSAPLDLNSQWAGDCVGGIQQQQCLEAHGTGCTGRNHCTQPCGKRHRRHRHGSRRCRAPTQPNRVCHRGLLHAFRQLRRSAISCPRPSCRRNSTTWRTSDGGHVPSETHLS